MTDPFRQRLKQGYTRTREFYAGAGCLFVLAQMQFDSLKDAVRRHQARERFAARARAAVRDAAP